MTKTRNEYLLSILKNDLKRVNAQIDRLWENISYHKQSGTNASKNITGACEYLIREQSRLEEEIYKLTH
jgi:hypothetical protein